MRVRARVRVRVGARARTRARVRVGSFNLTLIFRQLHGLPKALRDALRVLERK